MIILKVLNVWIMMGLLSYVFVCLFTIISLWLMEWHDCNEEIEKYQEGIYKAHRLLESMSNVMSFIFWLLKGPIMMILVIKTIIDVIIE